MKRIIALLLAVVMLLGVLAGCSNEPEKTPNETEGKTPVSTQGATEPAPTEKELEHVELTWYIKSASNVTDIETVTAAINEYLNETLKLNVTLNFVFPSSYSDQTQLALATGDAIDMAWTANWGGLDYLTNVAKEAFVPLDDLLAEYGQGILETIPAHGLEATRVNGSIYAIPNVQGWFTQAALYINKDIADKYNFDTSAVKSYKDLEPLLAQIKADYPDSYPIAVAGAGNIMTRCQYELNYTFLGGSSAAGAVLLDDASCRVVNAFELPQMKEYFETMYEWNQKGYIRADSAQMSTEDVVADMQAGKTFMTFDTYLPGDEISQEDRYSQTLYTILMGAPITTTGSVISTMTAITTCCENPERAMMVLNAVNTDPVLFNLLCYGIEGVHYNLNAEGCVVPVEGTTWAPGCAWSMGNTFNALREEGIPADNVEKTLAMNDAATVVPTMGFNFDATNVTNQISACSAVYEEFMATLQNGAMDPATVYPEFLAKMKTAGVDAIIAEMQAQLDAWMAAK